MNKDTPVSNDLSGSSVIMRISPAIGRVSDRAQMLRKQELPDVDSVFDKACERFQPRWRGVECRGRAQSVVCVRHVVALVLRARFDSLIRAFEARL